MFERFTAEARAVVGAAEQHARRLRHGWVGCEHLLLAVAASPAPAGALLRRAGAGPEAVEGAIVAAIGSGRGDGDDEVALASLGIDLAQVRDAVEATFGPGALDPAPSCRKRRGLRRRRPSVPARTATLPFTPRAKRCLELSLREALRRRDEHIGVEHVALSLLALDGTAARAILRVLGVATDELRRSIEQSYRRTA